MTPWDEETLALVNRWFKPGTALEEYGCHAFVFCEFPQGHPNRVQGIREYWLHQFGTGHDEVSPKGIAVVSVGGGLKP